MMKVSSAQYLINNMYKLVRMKETDQITKKVLIKKLAELSELAKLSQEGKETALRSRQNKRRIQLLEKYQADDEYEAIAKVVREINDYYNPHNTDYFRYLDLKVQLFEYTAKNNKELQGLDELITTAYKYRANVLAEELEKSQKQLIKEEEDLHLLVARLNPRKKKEEIWWLFNYYRVTHYLQRKIALYEGKNRVELLGAYQRFLQDYDDSSMMKRMWVEAANRYLCNRKPQLEKQIESAQDLREPVRERGVSRERDSRQRQYGRERELVR